ncbi:tripartite tricarboxylate transporter substrate binding protein [Roseomonas sp. KE0001]|uniref:Bug family tripartite tricarboxylate transporter substrate binding protein n=1 Tax=Roseomonas sp. KE0001 TaxID=2479201 RepID=UPI0018DF031B|nr:tripartite tricarboxylate transporter substrate-binding protein [Roseomonas sp. KE0001]MBI0433349.1 tripartite tricarboxylate transporter substrate binding protein [Roseomonas sp. KE0001]
MPVRRALLALALAAPPAALAPRAARAMPGGHAADWPESPVRLILPDSPGSGNDTTARLIAPELEALLGQPFVIENRGGAGGRIGVEAAWKAAPDGYSFLFGNAGSNGINAAIYRNLPYDLASAFEPVSLLVQGPNVLVVNQRLLPARDLPSLIAMLRTAPGSLNYASGGIGSSAHMSMELFKARAGLDILHIPYRGTPAMAQSVIAGDTALMFANLVNVMPYIERGEVRAIAVTARAPVPELPGVPAVAEVLPGFETLAWNGILAPPGTPEPIRDRLLAALVTLRTSEPLRGRIRRLGGQLVISPPEVFAERIASDIRQWKQLAGQAGIQAE